MVHDHPGVVTDFFLAVENYNGRGQPRHDLGLYEVFWSLAMMGLVLWLGSKPRPRGFFMALVPICYAPIRFSLDYLREVPTFGGDVRYGGFTPGQYWAVVMLFAGIMVALKVKSGPEPELYLDGAPPEEPKPATSDKAKKSKGKGGKRKR